MTDDRAVRLGRLPFQPDPRDFRLVDFQVSDTDLVAQAVAELKQTTVGYAYYTRRGVVPPRSSHWFKALALLGQVGQEPEQPQGDVVWDNDRQLDQGETPHCVGFGWAQWGNSEPVEDSYADSDGHDIYYEIKVIEGDPGAENGAYVRDGAKAMQNRSRLGAYAFADDLPEALSHLRSKGPVVVGTDWYSGMFDPGPTGLVRPTGQVEGGHCYLMVGDLQTEKKLLFQNSWGDGWGVDGRFKMSHTDFSGLLEAQGEALAGLELALP